MNISCNSHQQETVILPGVLAMPAVALSVPVALGLGQQVS